MKILIDLQSCQSGSRLGGIGRYSMALAKAMITVGEKHDFYILLNRKLPGEHQIRDRLKSVLPQARIIAMDIPSNVAHSFTIKQGKIIQTRLAELIREKIIYDLEPDLVHISSLIEGYGDEVVTSVGLLFDASRTVVTLYDLIPLVERARYLTSDEIEQHYFEKIAYMKRAGGLLAISDYSKSEGTEVGGISADVVVNISSAVDQKFKPRKVSTNREEYIRKQFGISKKFLMYVGSFDSRKNQEGLVRAFACTSDELKKNYQLVIIGNGWEEVYQSLRRIGEESGLRADAILFLGHVDDETLVDLYNLCTLFVFPSLREGFGLPVLEAMSCATPAIGSNRTSVPEVLGRSDATFDPTDINSIAQKITQALSDNWFYESLKAHAINHSKKFSWEISAIKALEFLEKSFQKKPLPTNSLLKREVHFESSYRSFLHQARELEGFHATADEFLKSAAYAIAYNESLVKQLFNSTERKIRIGWITTWQTRCGIASYSRNLISSINHEPHIFAPIDNHLLGTDEDNVTRCWHLGGGGFHALEAAIEDVGVEILSLQLNYGFHDFPTLAEFIFKQKKVGRLVTVTLHATIDPPVRILDRKLSQLSAALNECDAVLVHSLSDVENLEKIDVKGNVVYFPQGVVNPVASKVSRTRSFFKIATYGFALPHKGLEQVLVAVNLLLSEGLEVRLEMVNAMYSVAASGELIASCEKIIDEYGIRSNVDLITDYLDDAESLSRLADADLIVFAYQNTTESSSAAVRMGLASGALVAVTPLKIFDDVADCVYVLPGISPQDIAQGIGEVIRQVSSNGGKLEDIRKSASRWVACNQFDNAGNYYLNLIGLALDQVQ